MTLTNKQVDKALKQWIELYMRNYITKNSVEYYIKQSEIEGGLTKNEANFIRSELKTFNKLPISYRQYSKSKVSGLPSGVTGEAPRKTTKQVAENLLKFARNVKNNPDSTYCVPGGRISRRRNTAKKTVAKVKGIQSLPVNVQKTIMSMNGKFKKPKTEWY